MNLLQKVCSSLIHCDIWGPYHIPSCQVFRYFSIIMDDYNRYTLVYMFKNKSDIIQIIPSFYQMVVTQFENKIKISRSDNAKELEFKDFFCLQPMD